ncbi:MAG: isoprenylcysteine carboxylmethyltransferase family protein [Leptospiraceae bacterium]|nr:hypothetical protein [Leptospiraceae bacterium]MCP5496544.1 isoprenylcysteine carboxylmethyltransferase family protein [Leptospiraceae bacterium]
MMRQFMIRVGNFFFRWRDTAFSLIFLPALYLVTFPEHAIGDFWVDILTSVAGFVLMLTGQIIRGITIGYAYIKRGGLNKQIYAQTLVHRGMFAHCRNPLYLGNLLIVTGGIITINIIWYDLIVLPLFYFIYLSITVAEEEFLRGKFGKEYDEYVKNVNRFLPSNLGKWKESIEGMDFTWKRFFKKEYSSLFIVFSVYFLSNLLKYHFRHGLKFNDPIALAQWGFIGTLFVILIVTQILARANKLEWGERP